MKAKFFCLLIIFVIFTGTVWIFWNKKSEEKAILLPSSSPSSTPIAKSPDGFGKLIKKENHEEFVSSAPFGDWPFYRNTAFNYQIRYPPELVSSAQDEKGMKVLDLVDFSISKGGKTASVVVIKLVDVFYSEIKTEVLADKAGYPDAKETLVVGISAVRTFEGVEDEVIFPSKDGSCTFRISVIPKLEEKSNLDMFEKMLSSFSFLD